MASLTFPFSSLEVTCSHLHKHLSCVVFNSFEGGGLMVSLFNAPNFLSVSHRTRFVKSTVPAFVCPPLNFSCFYSFLPTWRPVLGYVVVWSGFIMSPCSSTSAADSYFHFQLSRGTCPVNDTQICQHMQQNSIRVVLNDDIIIDSSFPNAFQENLTVACNLWPGALNSIQIWWRHQRHPIVEDIRFHVTTSCASQMVLPSSFWFHSNSDDFLVGAWPKRILFQNFLGILF
jgi:translation initiation factor IF-1